MNERIKLLAEQAQIWIADFNGQRWEIDPEKFAELIVKECSQFVEDKFDFCGDEIIIAEKIKEHFGVEE